MTWPLGSRRVTALALLAVVATAAVGFLPLLAGPGYESALASGLILPPLAAIAAALDQLRIRAKPFDALSHGVALGVTFAVFGYVVTLLHGVRVGFCSPVHGSVLFALGPGVGCMMGGAYGTLSGELLLMRRPPALRGAAPTMLWPPTCPSPPFVPFLPCFSLWQAPALGSC